ncbi:MAG: DUF456 domain-containing protein [Anaerolineae bacterium]|nr:DUF456 domain-containing protein [Anaerolineae bacterium]
MVLPPWAFWVTLAVMLVGLLGVILPILPGIGLIWLAALAYAIAERFATIDLVTFAALTILGVIGYSANLWASQIGAKAGGAAFTSLLLGFLTGLIGALVGWLLFGIGAIAGALIGALLGIVFAEWKRREDWREALKVGGGWLAGCALSGIVQFTIGVLMILIFVWQALKG